MWHRIAARPGSTVYRPERLVLEALGHAFHSSPAQLSSDAARLSRLQLEGCTVHQFTYDQIVGNPAWVIEVVRSALAQAAPISAVR